MNLVQNGTVGEVPHCVVGSLELLLHYVKIILQGRTTWHEHSRTVCDCHITRHLKLYSKNHHLLSQFSLNVTLIATMNNDTWVTWWLHDSHMTITWAPHNHHVTSTWHHMSTTQPAYDYSVEKITWRSDNRASMMYVWIASKLCWLIFLLTSWPSRID